MHVYMHVAVKDRQVSCCERRNFEFNMTKTFALTAPFIGHSLQNVVAQLDEVSLAVVCARFEVPCSSHLHMPVVT